MEIRPAAGDAFRTKWDNDDFKAYHIKVAQLMLVLRMPPTYPTLSSLDVISTVKAQCPVHCEHTTCTKMGKWPQG